MRRIVLALAITALAIPLMGTLEPAEARIRWSGGAEFSVGGIFFSLGFSDYDRYGHGPGYFYRTNHALNYNGYQCGSACYLNDGYAYHDRGCPLLQRHFAYFGFNAGHHWASYGYSRYGYRSHRYGPYYGGYRYDRRYDRRHHRRHNYRDRRDHRRRHDYRSGRRDDHRRRDSHADSDRRDRRRDDRYDRRDRDRKRDDRYNRRDDRGDSRRGKGKASSTRSRRRHN